jgi:hypothetical protein
MPNRNIVTLLRGTPGSRLRLKTQEIKIALQKSSNSSVLGFEWLFCSSLFAHVICLYQARKEWINY